MSKKVNKVKQIFQAESLIHQMLHQFWGSTENHIGGEIMTNILKKKIMGTILNH